MTSESIIVMTLDIIVAFNMTAAFVITLVSLLTSTPVM
jgi:hypothetical protein